MSNSLSRLQYHVNSSIGAVNLNIRLISFERKSENKEDVDS